MKILIFYMLFNLISSGIFLRLTPKLDMSDEQMNYLLFYEYFFGLHKCEYYGILYIFIIFPWYAYRYCKVYRDVRRRELVDKMTEELTG